MLLTLFRLSKQRNQLRCSRLGCLQSNSVPHLYKYSASLDFVGNDIPSSNIFSNVKFYSGIWKFLRVVKMNITELRGVAHRLFKCTTVVELFCFAFS